MVHSSRDMTPAQAKQPGNQAIIKGRLEVGRIKTRNYPPVNVGDTVKVFKKKDKMDKENVSTWRTENYKVESIEESHGQKFYTLNPKPPQWKKPLIRSEILLIQ